MHNTSLLKAIPKSFYSKELYREVGREWQGYGFSYLFAAIAIFCLPVAVAALIYSFTITLDKPFAFNSFIDQIPVMTVKNGEIHTDVAMPYYIKDRETGAAIAIIDTTRPVTDWSQNMSQYRVLAVVGKDQIIINRNLNSKTGEKRLYDIPREMNTVITSDSVRAQANELLDYAWLGVIISAVILVLMWFVSRIVLMFLYGILGKIMDFALRTGFSYTDCVRLASVASTATIALFLLSIIFTIHLSGWTYFAVNTLYLFYAIGINRT